MNQVALCNAAAASIGRGPDRRNRLDGAVIIATVLRIKDGLPKMKDLPKEMGGSGEILPE